MWAHGAQVYVAAHDSLPLAPGDRVMFRERSRTLASGLVERIVDRHVAVVEVGEGSLARVKKPERLHLLAERPPVGPAHRLRLGYPAANRAREHVACERLTLRLPVPDSTYRVESRGLRNERLVRNPAVAVEAPWPDTLEVSLFEEVTDEEIALERGELDVAMFWPGELSRHMREQPRWSDPPNGAWSGPDSVAGVLRCPVLCEPRLLPTVRALGADALIGAIECGPRQGGP